MSRKYLYILMLLAVAIGIMSDNLWMGDGYTIRSLFNEFSLLKMVQIPDGFFFISPIPVIMGSIMTFSTWSIILLPIYIYIISLMAGCDDKYKILYVLPVLQVFIGYTEIYAAVYLCSLVVYYLFMVGKNQEAYLMSVVAILCHSVMALPIVVFACMKALERRNWFVMTAIGVMYSSYIGFMYATFTRDSTLFKFTGYYSMFSVEHLVELALLALFLFGWMLFNGGSRKIRTFEVDSFAISALSAIGAVFIIVPHLGVVRDWDLLSLCCFPITMWYLSYTERLGFKAMIYPILVTGSFILFNSSPRLYEMAWIMNHSPQYNAKFMGGRVKNITEFIYNKEEHLNMRIGR